MRRATLVARLLLCCTAHPPSLPGLFFSMRSAFTPFRSRSYRFQWPADLLTSWALEMEFLILGWYVLVDRLGRAADPVRRLAAWRHADRADPRRRQRPHRPAQSPDRDAHDLRHHRHDPDDARLRRHAQSGDRAGDGRPHGSGPAVRPRAARRADRRHHPHEQLTGAMGMSRITSDTARIAGAHRRRAVRVARHGTHLHRDRQLLRGQRVLDRLRRNSAHSKTATEPVTAAVTGRVSAWNDLREGIVHIWNTPSLMAIIWLVLLFNFTAFPLTNALLPYVAREIYHVDQAGLAYLIASISFGAMLGGLLMSRVSAFSQLPRLMIAAAVAWHALLLVFAQMQTLPSGIAIILVTGVFQSLGKHFHRRWCSKYLL